MDLRRFVAPALVGVVVAAGFGVWALATRHSATAEVVEGRAAPNASGTAISLHAGDGTGAGAGYVVAGVPWAGRDGVWHEGSDLPTCVGTDTAALTRVRLGIVHVAAGEEGIGGPRAVWLRCLD